MQELQDPYGEDQVRAEVARAHARWSAEGVMPRSDSVLGDPEQLAELFRRRDWARARLLEYGLELVAADPIRAGEVEHLARIAWLYDRCDALQKAAAADPTIGFEKSLLVDGPLREKADAELEACYPTIRDGDPARIPLASAAGLPDDAAECPDMAQAARAYAITGDQRFIESYEVDLHHLAA